MSEKQRSYTPDQHAAVRRVMACSVTAYYEILNIQKPSHETEIKKSYRKLALVMHPDKNAAPKADEAFKRVSKAFQVLSDPDKKRIYDSTGADPEVRGGGASSGFARAAGGGGGFPRGAGFQGDISPEELFNAFFGGQFGGGGSPFGGAQFGGGFGPNMQFYSFGGPGGGFGAQPRAQNRGQQPDEIPNLRSWLPMIGMIVLLFFISWATNSDTQASSVPRYSFQQSSVFNTERFTPRYSVPFYVNPKDIANLNTAKLNRLDRQVETRYVSMVKTRCKDEYFDQLEMKRRAEGWFSRDEELYQQAMDLPMTHCEILNNLGIQRDEL